MIKISRYFIACLLTLCGFAEAMAQTAPDSVSPCGFNAAHEELLKQHPELAAEMALDAMRLESQTRNFAKDNRNDVYIIPVVFHVIHNNGIENISDEQIHDAIAAMNEDFSASNSNVGQVHEAFADIVGNAGIEFRLAQLDPDGNCTSGIIRTYSSTTLQGGENLKEASPIWDRSRYLNIWTCRTIESGAAGYSYYPSSMDNSFGLQADGIVVRSDYVGRIGTSTSSHGHTLSHEAGHWLNLAHLWGSTNEPGEESNCWTDDGVADTPNTIGWTACALNGWSCGSLDNVENFMEYSYCGKMFSQGQVNRMISALNSTISDRNNLWSPENLIATGVQQEAELCKVDFEVNKKLICVGETVTFNDRSYNAVAGKLWQFEGADEPVSTEDNPQVTYSQPGVFAVTLTAWSLTDTLTEIRPEYIVVRDTGFHPLPFVEDFEAVDSFGGSSPWQLETADDPIHWEVNETVGYSGNRSAYIQGSLNARGEKEALVSSTIDAANLSENGSVTFRYAYGKRTASPSDKLRVYFSRNCGQQWIERLVLTGADLATVSGIKSPDFAPSSPEDWRQVVINTLTFPYWTNTFLIKFEFESGYFSNTLYLDDINVVAEQVMAVGTTPAFPKLAAFPNPASGAVTFSGLPRDRQISVKLYDLAGRLVKQVSGVAAAGELEFPLQQLAKGMYMAQVSDGRSLQTIRLQVE